MAIVAVSLLQCRCCSAVVEVSSLHVVLQRGVCCSVVVVVPCCSVVLQCRCCV